MSDSPRDLDQAPASVELINRAQAGDRDALSHLFGRYYERVRAIIRVRLGAKLRRHTESGDLLQETFLAAVQHFDRFEVREDAGLVHWLAKIAERQIIREHDYQFARKRDRANEVALEGLRKSMSSGALTLDPAASLPLPVDAAAQGEQIVNLLECIEELKDDYREVIALRNYAGMSWDAVAETMESPSANAARMLHARALVELSALVQRRQ